MRQVLRRERSRKQATEAITSLVYLRKKFINPRMWGQSREGLVRRAR